MNILPFVFTFLLLLTFMSSLMFSCYIRLTREKEILLTSHDTYLSLLSQQQKELYQQRKPETKSSPSAKSISPKKGSSENFRDHQHGADASKLYLFAMIHDSDEAVRLSIQKIACRLIENLYSACDFYQTANKKEIAQTIVNEMCTQKIKTLEALKLKDPELDTIYYKILKGTSSGYPTLAEYCHLGKTLGAPIHFRFASTPVMQAAIGKELAAKLFNLEIKNKEENSRVRALKKKAFIQLVKADASSGIPSDVLIKLFDYKNKKKGISQSCKDGRGKIRVARLIKRE